VSYWGSEPEFHLWLEANGLPVAQLGFGRRVVGVGETELQIAGIGAVCVSPEHQGRGVGKQLLHELHQVLTHAVPTDFGFLQCRGGVVGFYERGGLVRVSQAAHFFDPDEARWVTHAGPTMILPARSALMDWPEGEVDLRGLPW
jgi:nodulation protein A